jgi:hypothetical protein
MLSVSRDIRTVTKKKGICLRTAASLIMARFDNPLSLMFNVVQITGGGTIGKGISLRMDSEVSSSDTNMIKRKRTCSIRRAKEGS